MDYLIEKGHRRIAIITGAEDDRSIGESRLAGYRESLLAAGLTYDQKLVQYVDSSTTYTMENGYEAAARLLSREPGISCIFAVSDTLAIGACKAVLDAGLRIPDDISVAGFDGIEMTKFYNPSITTICQPREEMAREAVKVLFELMKKKELSRSKYLFEGILQEGVSVR